MHVGDCGRGCMAHWILRVTIMQMYGGIGPFVRQLRRFSVPCVCEYARACVVTRRHTHTFLKHGHLTGTHAPKRYPCAKTGRANMERRASRASHSHSHTLTPTLMPSLTITLTPTLALKPTLSLTLRFAHAHAHDRARLWKLLAAWETFSGLPWEPLLPLP